MRSVVIAGLAALAGSCATTPETDAPLRFDGARLVLSAGSGEYALHEIIPDSDPRPAREIDAGGRMLRVGAEALASLESGRANEVPGRAATGACVLLANAAGRALPVWPTANGEDRFRFNLRPAARLLATRDEVREAEQDLDRAYLAELAARRTVSDAQERLDASPAYANRQCTQLRSVDLPPPSNVRTPAAAFKAAESTVQEAMVARFGCGRAGQALVQLGRRPEWPGFAAGFNCATGASAKDHREAQLSIVADAFAMQMLACTADVRTGSPAPSICGAPFVASATSRYDQDVASLGDRLQQPYLVWQARVRNEQARIDQINQACSADLSLVRSGPSGIASAERNVAGRKADLAAAQKRLEDVLGSAVSTSDLRCG